VLPGRVGRAILGPFALKESVDQLNKQLGVDGSLYSQYFHWIINALRGNFGDSYKFRAPVTDFLGTAFWASSKLAIVTLVIVVPLGIIGGVVAALRQGRTTDRVITVTSLSLAVTPEFAVGIVLILFFAVRLHWFPSGGSADGSIVDQLKMLVLPALTLSATLFGYIARMTRAGMIEALSADYTRTAELKGLTKSRVL
jgi:peptide/nickel transport system permease protein